MQNYQLYRSNVLLGGQMKYDLIVDSNGQDLIVSDFHITPISKSVNFNKYSKDSLLNYSHKENISRFYKTISGSFFNDCADPLLTGLHPLVTDNIIDLHNGEFEMGCRRMSYQLYGKQFGFFCPLWIEHLTEEEYLNFQFEIYSNIKSSTPIVTKNLILKPTDKSYHNKFIDYLREYIEYIGIKNGIEDVINIDVKNGISSVSGFNVLTGMSQIKRLPSLLENLLSREIPLLEFDNMIIRNIPDNKLITRQLFNFNICFNLDDIITPVLYNLLKGDNIIIRLNVGVTREDGKLSKDNLFPKRDFFSNYDYIQKKFCGFELVERSGNELLISAHKNDERRNVLNYLKDNLALQYVYKNKITQSTIHWSLFDNNDYILNAYDGYAGYENSGDDSGNDDVLLSHNYANAPDILSKQYKTPNSLTWCNGIKFGDTVRHISYQDLNSLVKLCSKFQNNSWVNCLKYEMGHNVQIGEEPEIPTPEPKPEPDVFNYSGKLLFRNVNGSEADVPDDCKGGIRFSVKLKTDETENDETIETDFYTYEDEEGIKFQFKTIGKAAKSITFEHNTHGNLTYHINDTSGGTDNTYIEIPFYVKTDWNITVKSVDGKKSLPGVPIELQIFVDDGEELKLEGKQTKFDSEKKDTLASFDIKLNEIFSTHNEMLYAYDKIKIQAVLKGVGVGGVNISCVYKGEDVTCHARCGWYELVNERYADGSPKYTYKILRNYALYPIPQNEQSDGICLDLNGWTLDPDPTKSGIAIYSCNWNAVKELQDALPGLGDNWSMSYDTLRRILDSSGASLLEIKPERQSEDSNISKHIYWGNNAGSEFCTVILVDKSKVKNDYGAGMIDKQWNWQSTSEDNILFSIVYHDSLQKTLTKFDSYNSNYNVTVWGKNDIENVEFPDTYNSSVASLNSLENEHIASSYMIRSTSQTTPIVIDESNESDINDDSVEYPYTYLNVLLIQDEPKDFVDNLQNYMMISPNDDEDTYKILFLNSTNESDVVDTIFVIANEKNIKTFTYKGMINELKEMMEDQLNENFILSNIQDTDVEKSKKKCLAILSFLKDLLEKNKAWKSMVTIVQPSSLDLSKSDSPSLSSTEIDYYKSTKSGTYIHRYFGKIKPTFFDPNDYMEERFNYRFYKKIIKPQDFNSSIFQKYNGTGFSPSYPSIDYYGLDKKDEYYNLDEDHIDSPEYHVFNDNNIFILDHRIDAKIPSAIGLNGKYVKLKELVKDYLRQYYNIEDIPANQKLIQYIDSLYEFTSSFDYASPTDINNYIYDVKITLK